ncbi:hypothetical protein [Streptomyces sp. NPDC058872]|uniref:hypothetical protein n=1 Tax=Streptomyces sp. NPDC058872 TaxID=3346661 RepID=UPI0036A4250E
MTEQTVRTPYAHKIRYGVTGAPHLPNPDLPAFGVIPALVELIYSAARGDRPARISASVTGYLTRNGTKVRPGNKVAQHYVDGPDGWPEWLAAEARHHAPVVRNAARVAARQTTRQDDTDCPACDAGIEHTEHCPTPETHNWGCGCPTDEKPAADRRDADQPDPTTANDPTTAVEPQDHPGADLYARLRAAGEDHDTAQALIYAHARMTIRQHTATHDDAPFIRPCSCGITAPHTFCPPTWDTGTNDEAAPAVGQPAETPHTDEARPPVHRWAAELHDPLADEWVPGTRYSDRDRAVAALAHARAVGSTWKDGTPVDRRLVREDTTWTVEDKR